MKKIRLFHFLILALIFISQNKAFPYTFDGDQFSAIDDLGNFVPGEWFDDDGDGFYDSFVEGVGPIGGDIINIYDFDGDGIYEIYGNDWDFDSIEDEIHYTSTDFLHRLSLEKSPVNESGGTITIIAQEAPGGKNHWELTSLYTNASNVILPNTEVKLTAAASPGYIFRNWQTSEEIEIPDLNITTISYQAPASQSSSITAVFEKDLSDSDGDGLSNYDEIVVHSTSPSESDSDADGLADGVEVSINSNPNKSDAAIVSYFQNSGNSGGNSYAQGIVDGRTQMFDKIHNLITSIGLNFGIQLNEDIQNLSYQDVVDGNGSINLSEIQLVIEQFIDSDDTNFTPYTSGWFYTSEQGWLWTSIEMYPFIYRNNYGWLYFKKGHASPKFYDFQTKSWFNLN